ncbi:hypothetical protein [Paenibacillus sp. MAEPY2]|uniref:hypothetical protein n=2 Tax=Paenibacillus TaxID=44249 RepID=UPI0004672F37|nr:hypothetical protein [Paenibacillus sp. MAEPY2]KGP78662.1 hypothetical protein P364_0127450 [Paenibacillus sp. MAEPY2]KGP86153.1 hypothetical protein P363_0118955 [Paenibacillus sp. MAEPY1]OZQ71046.1 hypothetical protein CA599_10945 [Paenibacillus taichungensis]
MNQNTHDFIYYAAWIMIFAIALGSAALGLEQQQRYQGSIQEVSTMDYRLFTTTGSIEEETYTGAEVLQSVQRIQSIKADIQVEGITFTPSIDIDNTDVSMVNLNKSYKAKYVRNSEGVITIIIFT